MTDLLRTLLADGGTICYHGCRVGDGLVAFAIAIGAVGMFWVLFRD